MQERPEANIGNHELMSEQEAYDLTKLMWAKMRMDPRSGEIRTEDPRTESQKQHNQFFGVPEGGFDNLPNAADYNLALSAIEKLSHAAAEESDFEKLKSRVAVILSSLSFNVKELIGSIFYSHPENDHGPNSRYARQQVKQKHHSVKVEGIKGPSAKLGDLRKAGSRIEKNAK